MSILYIYHNYLTRRLPKIKEWVDAHDAGSIIVPFSGSLESRLMDMSDGDKATLFKETSASRFIIILQNNCLTERYTGFKTDLSSQTCLTHCLKLIC